MIRERFTRGRDCAMRLIKYAVALAWLQTLFSQEVFPTELDIGSPRRQEVAQRWWSVLPPTPALPVPVEQGRAQVNGAAIHYARFGHGEPVIFLHGGLANSNYRGNQAPEVARRFEVIVIDMRGHGRSTFSSEPMSYDLLASDIVGVMDILKIQRAAIVGWTTVRSSA